MNEMALAIGEKIRLNTLPSHDSRVLLTLSTLEEKSEALPSPLRVKKCRSAVQSTFRKQQISQL